MVGKLIQYVVDTGATYYVLTVHAGHLAPWNLLYYRSRRKAKSKTFHHPSNLHLGKTLIIHKLLVMSECPSPLLGKGVSLSHGDNFYSLQKTKPRNVSGWTVYYYIRLGQSSPKYPPEIEKKKILSIYRSTDLELGNPGKAKFATPIKITLRKASNFPSRHQCPPCPANSLFLYTFSSQSSHFSFLPHLS